MIYIKEQQLPPTNIVPSIDKIIGVVENNNVDKRVFSFPRIFKNLDLSDDNYIFLLQIRPVNQKEKPYFHLLETEILTDEVRLIWKVTRTHTKDPGKLYANILIKNESDDIVWQSYILEFIIESGINATESIEEVPPNILDQYIIQAAAYAQNAKVEADRAKQAFEDIEDCLIDNKQTNCEDAQLGSIDIGKVVKDILFDEETFTIRVQYFDGTFKDVVKCLSSSGFVSV